MRKGHFSLFTFHHHPLRDERITIGVLLFDPTEGKLYCRMNPADVQQKINFHYPEVSPAFIESECAFIQEVVDGINERESNIENIELVCQEFFRFCFRVQPFRVYMVEDVEEDLDSLYKSQVGSEAEQRLWATTRS